MSQINQDKFNHYYSQLNPEQKQAVDNIEGPVMVIAGPGTGKTQILTLRIANILRLSDSEPDNILALTFTESGVASMRKRLAQIIGTPAYSVNITTFHSFCNEIIQHYPEEFSRIIGAKSISEVDQIKIIEEIITGSSAAQTGKLKSLRPFGDTFFYISPILKAINNLKNEAVTPEQFAQNIALEHQSFKTIDDLYHEKGAHKGKMKGKYQDMLKYIERNTELALIYDEYQQALAKAKFYDYSDMIMEVVKRLQQNQDLLLSLQEKYHYILVDEHQDTNNAQNKLLELIANFHENPNLFVVGDEKQAIFRFQGASLENFLYFQKLYPTALLINLERNYRSTQTILDSANNILSGKSQLKAQAGHAEKKLGLYALTSTDAENYFIATDIQNKIRSGIPPQNIAVLYRDNRDALSISYFLQKLSLPFVIKSNQDLLNDQEIKKIILVLETLHDYGSADKLFKIMHLNFFNINALDIYKIADYIRANKKNPFDVIADTTILAEIGCVSIDSLSKLSKNLTRWQEILHNHNFAELFSDIVRESGLLAYALARSDKFEILDKINKLFHHIRGFIEENKDYGLGDFIAYITLLKEHGLLINYSPANRETAVQLMTAHRSKGLEFEYVYIINVFDGHWGNRRRISHIKLPSSVGKLVHDNKATERTDLSAEQASDDERNLFYVALTRAKKEVLISYSQSSLSGKEQLVSQFVQEINPDLIEYHDTSSYEKDFQNHQDIFFNSPVATEHDTKAQDFVRNILLTHGLSVTAINNYLKCPWRYFYENLLQIPRATSKHQLYGIAIHAALRTYFDQRSKDPKTDSSIVIRAFGQELNKLPLTASDYSECLRQGERALQGYYDHYHDRLPYNVLNEFNIKGIELTPEIKLRGMIDKIELLDGSGMPIYDSDGLAAQTNLQYHGRVNVVDYKTGKPKSRGIIEGSVKDGDGDYKRQLVFYNILLNHYHNGQYQMISGEIDFVEPDDKGNYKKELFTISPKEIEELTQLIKKIGGEILELSFWNSTCDDKDCTYCQLRSLTT